MLTKLKLHNFRTYLNAEIDFKQRHLLIGRNNSGKTNLATSIRFLGSTTSLDLNAAAATWVPGGINEMTNWHLRKDANTPNEMECVCELDYDGERCQFTYELALKIDSSSNLSAPGTLELRVAKERLLLHSPSFKDAVLLNNNGHEATMLHEEQQAKGSTVPYTPKTLAPRNATMLSKLYELDTNRRAILFRKFLSSWNYYLLSPDAMRRGWREASAGINVVLNPLGENLANVIFQLKNMDEMRYRRLLNHVQILEPDLEAINFVATPEQGSVPIVALRNCPRASWIGFSDGTLRTLALACIVEVSGNFPNPYSPVPCLNLIEEPENGIAPIALGKIFDLFEERAPQGQFIFTSHSPYVIDRFDGARECVALLKRKNERTEITPLPPITPEDQKPDRLTLAEQYAAELLD